MRIAIIGAGAAGLSALKHSLDEGHTCVVFEQTGYIGGTWKYVEEVGKDQYGLPILSSMYKHLRTNIPKESMLFEDFPYRNGPEYSYVSHEEVLRYMEDYSHHFALLPHIRFFHHILEISPLPQERWVVEARNLKTDEKGKEEFDYVMICSGQFSDPVTPKLPGMELFKGTLTHSHDYRKPDPYINRKVLIVGFGFSGIDIGRALAKVAKQVFISFKLPVKNWFAHSLPDSIIRIPEIHEFHEKSVKFIDGTIEEFDDVIFCTGYRISFPFLSPECGLLVEDTFVKYLYKHVINVKHPTMAIIGLPINIPPFPMFCLQVRFFFAYLKGQFKVTREEMMADIEKYINACKDAGKPPDMDTQGEIRAYMGDLANTAGIVGTKPVIFELFEFLLKEAFGKYEISFKIVDDEKFEYFHYNVDEPNKL